jgi:hypothetical protein
LPPRHGDDSESIAGLRIDFGYVWRRLATKIAAILSVF